MRNVALDLGKRISFCEVVEGEVRTRRTVSSIGDLARELGEGTPPARVAIEACREAWHVHDALTSHGHEVWLVDTTRVKQLGIGHHKRKTDRIDAEVLARAMEEERIPRAHLLSAPRRKLREALGLRNILVKSRSSHITTTRGLLRARGVRLPDCAAEKFAAMLKTSQLLEDQRRLVEPLLTSITQLDAGVFEATARLEALAMSEPVILQLKTVPGVATVVASAFVSVVDNADRFHNAHQVEAYVGLVPSENTSGQRKLGNITKQGNSYLRAVLMQAAWCIIRTQHANPLRTWALSVARRRGKNIAVVALARRLVGILWAMWRDGTAYSPTRVGKESAAGLEEQANKTALLASAMRGSTGEPNHSAFQRARQKTPAAIRKRALAINNAGLDP